MIPLLVLTVATAIAWLVRRDWPFAVRAGLAVMFTFTAVAHFNSMRPDLVRMVPPQIPNPEFVVTFTGICEILGAVGLLLPQTRRLAAIALIALLIAVLPANIHAALSQITFAGRPATPLVPRIVLQCLFIALLWWSALRGRENPRMSVNKRNT